MLQGVFLDTNVLVYLMSDDPAKADIAEDLLCGGVVSSGSERVRAVSMRKLGLRLDEVRELLSGIRRFCRVEPVTLETHELGLAFCDRYGYSIYDSMILAAATLSGCETLMSEDMQTNQTIARGLYIRNPFAGED